MPPTAWATSRGAGSSLVDLRLATPAIVGGLRIATVTVIGLVTVAALVGSGGYGTFIDDGLSRKFSTPIVVGGVLSIVMAVAFDLALRAAPASAHPVDADRRSGGRLMLQEALDYLTDNDSWWGRNGLATLTWNHVRLSLFAVRRGRWSPPSRRRCGSATDDAAASWPSPWSTSAGPSPPSPSSPSSSRCRWSTASASGFWPTFVALFFLALPPIFVNAYTGRQRDRPRRGRGREGHGHARPRGAVRRRAPRGHAR